MGIAFFWPTPGVESDSRGRGGFRDLIVLCNGSHPFPDPVAALKRGRSSTLQFAT